MSLFSSVFVTTKKGYLERVLEVGTKRREDIREGAVVRVRYGHRFRSHWSWSQGGHFITVGPVTKSETDGHST